MEDFIREQNIRLFRAKLAEVTDPAERAELLKLLAREEAKPVTPAESRATRPKSEGDE